MTRTTRRLVAAAAVVLLVALGIGLAIAALQEPGSPKVRVPGTATVVKSFAPEDPQFGDSVTATIDVYVNLRRVDLDTVTIDGSFTPFRIVSSERRTTRHGTVGIVHVENRLRCLDPACVPASDPARVRLAPVQVSYAIGARTQTLASHWPALRLHPRVSAPDVKKPFFRVGAPQASGGGYRLPPTATGIALIVLAGLLAIGGATLLVGAIRGGLRVRGRRLEAPLERIIRELTAASSNGDSGRRRRALEELARELAPLDGPLSAESRVLAWGPRDPNPETIEELTARVLGAMKR